MFVFSVFCIGFFKDNITIDNLRYLIKYIDLSSSDSSPSKTEISISTDESSEFFMLGKDLAVVSNSGVGLYGFSGNKLYQYDHTYASCAALQEPTTCLYTIPAEIILKYIVPYQKFLR